MCWPWKRLLVFVFGALKRAIFFFGALKRAVYLFFLGPWKELICFFLSPEKDIFFYLPSSLWWWNPLPLRHSWPSIPRWPRPRQVGFLKLTRQSRLKWMMGSSSSGVICGNRMYGTSKPCTSIPESHEGVAGSQSSFSLSTTSSSIEDGGGEWRLGVSFHMISKGLKPLACLVRCSQLKKAANPCSGAKMARDWHLHL